MKPEKIRVMVDGLPGKMATEVAIAVDKAPDMELLPFSMTGPETEAEIILINNLPIKLFKPYEKSSLLMHLVSQHPDVTCNYTLPSAINECIEFYTMIRLPFVLGTTGGDIQYITKMIVESNINAVVAPNMAKEIVAFQMTMEYMAENFPLLFKNYFLQITESHQKTKADTSGTAKAMVGVFNKLGIEFNVDQIVKKRSEEDYTTMNVPTEHWGGHGYHTYSLIKKDGSVALEFTHNVNGRQAYIDGTLDAIRFLYKNESTEITGGNGKVFSMFDVLKG